uniref:Protein farnesyltransferase subunit beta n=1 Tax=Araucaria cunninghamii TaxID=56994 RepID=A0A0D6R496_ARACU
MAGVSSKSCSSQHLTSTQTEQLQVEQKVQEFFKALSADNHNVLLELWRDVHIDYLLRSIRHLGPSYSVLDANRPWLCYWILHSVVLLGEPIDGELRQRTVDFLSRCQDPNGGYGGGPGQMPHLATTYAAVNTLVTVGGEMALASINREKMLNFLFRMKDPSGAFRMHDAGEMDVRGCYTAISVASMLGILDPSLLYNLSNYIVSCQTYEGGIGGEPGAEAHGGYTFCGLAALILINEAHRLDLSSLLGRVEGGFQGRTNKLVDGCYSFWQGGVFALIQRLSEVMLQQACMSYAKAGQMEIENNSSSRTESGKVKKSPSSKVTSSGGGRVVQGSNVQQLDATETDSFCEDSSSMLTAEKIFPVFDYFHKTSLSIGTVDEDSAASSKSSGGSSQSNDDYGLSFLEKDIQCGPLFNTHALQGYILLCAQVLEGGLRDKPGKSRDAYHTCYCLSGLSTAQYSWSPRIGTPPPPAAVLGPLTNLLESVHPLHNVLLERYYDAQEYISGLL